MSKTEELPKKYAVNICSSGEGLNVAYKLAPSSVNEVSVVSGALAVTQHPIFSGEGQESRTRVVVFPFQNHESIEYQLVDLKEAVLAALIGNRDDDIFDWLAEQRISIPGSRWRFETKVLGEDVVFSKGYSKWLDEAVEEFLRDRENGRKTHRS